MPPGFDPELHFGDEDGEGRLGWEERRKVMFRIYDEGKFPPDLLPDGER